jgi:hypothetical protein
MSRFRAALAVALALLASPRAHADFHVVSPYEIDLGELEIEHNGSSSFDHRNDVSRERSYTIELGTGLTSWWHSEIELGIERDPGFSEPTILTTVVTENTFQLTEPGEAIADFGFYVEYGQSLTRGPHAASNQVTFGPVIAKDIGRFTHTVNLFFSRELGPDRDSHDFDFSYAWQSRWNVWQPLSPAVEIYGDAGPVSHMPKLSQQQLLAGPVAVGAINLHDLGLGHSGKLKYELGWLFGLTGATASGTLRWRTEVEIPF